jgi:carbon storage regulator
MLVLSRKNRETVVIDGRITVKILQIKGNTIRLGIEAPPEMSIRRGELLEITTLEFEAPVEALDCDVSPVAAADLATGVTYNCAAS